RCLSCHPNPSVALGDLLLLDGQWYVTHVGLLRLAQRRHCTGIRVQQVREFCDPEACRWVFKATLYKKPGAQGFVGFGDADPSNVSTLVHGAEMRIENSLNPSSLTYRRPHRKTGTH